MIQSPFRYYLLSASPHVQLVSKGREEHKGLQEKAWGLSIYISNWSYINIHASSNTF